VASLTTDQIVALTTAQAAAIETADIAALKTSQLVALETADLVALGTAQIVALTTAQVASLTTAQVAALTTAQAAAIETADIAAIKSSQITALTTANVAALTTGQIKAITTTDIAQLTTAQVFALTTDQVVALTTAQVQALTTTDLNALATSQIVAIETVDVAALKTSQIVALSTANLVALTTTQIGAFTSVQSAALTTGQVESLTSAQISAFSVANGATAALHLGTPIVLDLNGDGVSTQSIRKGVTFDLFANGKNVNTGWVSSTDGLLVMDRNHDGAINDGSELFGGATKLSGGSTASDGYAALRDMDGNHDGVIDKNDAAFADLKVWVDVNSDGVSGAGELKTLQDLGISSISALADVNLSKDNGNLIGLTSSYQTTDGATHAAADVWFVADRNQNVPAAVATVAPDAAPTTDLRSQVSSMAQALSTYAAADPVASTSTAAAPGSAPPATPATLAVSGMVSAMQQFDANGNAVKPQSPTAAPVTSLNLAGTQTATGGGVLASTVAPKPPGA
jgi:hypothetical protein